MMLVDNHFHQSVIYLLFLITNFIKARFTDSTGAMQCSRDELVASGIDVEGKPSFRKHEFTSRSLSEFNKNLPPTVIEDIKVRNTFINKLMKIIRYYYYKFRYLKLQMRPTLTYWKLDVAMVL